MKQHRSRTADEIPLYLLPQTISRKVREWGDAVYRISVKRTHWHHYNVTVRTKSVPRELVPMAEIVIKRPNEEPATGKPATRRRRGCPA